MINITILAIGKVRQNYVSIAINEYLERLAPYGKIKIEELKAEKFTEHNREQAKQKEAERISEYLTKRSGSRVIIMDERGKLVNSPDFSRLIDLEQKPIIFVIGGALGLAENIKRGYKEHISLSSLTLPHEMARLILTEQIYRGATIAMNKIYHY